ncbi:MAG: DUF2846 domain-containing protein [Deltaproteobacteria bacterium]|nr:DUF2846 domain-containing protein [Deltaproteobacteria bacterium]
MSELWRKSACGPASLIAGRSVAHQNRSRRWLLLILCLVLSGCVSAAKMISPPTVPVAPERADVEAKRFQPPPGMASVYVIREDKFAGQALLFQVSLDGQDQGKLARGTYFLLTVPPGKHAVAFTAGADKGTETVYAVEGGIYYLEIRPKSGMTAPPTNIFRIDQQRGRSLILAGKRAEITAAGH